MGKAHAVGGGENAHGWANEIAVLIEGLAEPLEVRFPAEPLPYQRRLLETIGARIVVDPTAPSQCPCKPLDRRRRTMLAECKVSGCNGSPEAAFGPDAGYCSTHKAARIEARRSNPRPTSTSGGVAEKVKRLATLAKEVDRKTALAKKKTEQALAAKRDADLAQRDLQSLARELMGGGAAA